MILSCEHPPEGHPELRHRDHRSIDLSIEAPAYAAEGEKDAPEHHPFVAFYGLPGGETVLLGGSFSGLLSLDIHVLDC